MEFLEIVKCKCPNCRRGRIFEKKGNILTVTMPKMYEHCKVCGFEFEKETGFFFGAMYVSYGLSAGLMIALMAVMWGVFDFEPFTIFITVALSVLLTSTYNFMVSRTIWIHFFYEKPSK